MNPQAQLALALFAYAAQRGVAPARLEKLAGVRVAELQAPAPGPLSAKQWQDLWLNAAHLTQDPLFGLRFGEAATPAALGIVGQLIQSCPTVGAAVTQAAALLPLLTDYLRLEVQRSAQAFTLRFRLTAAGQAAPPEVFGHLIDFLLMLVVHELDGLVLARLELRAVAYPPAARWLPDHGRTLRAASAREGQPGEYVLEFGGNYWDVPILTGNYELQAALLRKVDELRAAQPAVGQLRDKVAGHLLANSYLGLPSVEKLAANFNTSARSLQRQLRAEGTSYQDVADAVRKTLALHYLQARAHPLKEVSYMLGYNEFSAFSRAFKRWTGSSPARYRTAGPA
ncbi:AraC family transcriptional regulator ligand-binding domain-containing protein [Hymenobacter sp.]|uniref:AraC family transcriptional regulator n=1 Tax=Hymenobacter sp. TaxID=1898978 RepID=UPI00286BD96B|nr:AraC family transcriptional regulator ligand-binding domain-containing protein [Hymenobacter sp.]